MVSRQQASSSRIESAQVDAIDVDGNGVPDMCDPDCDGDGVIDALEIAAGAPDCNENGVPDDCDIVFGVLTDFNGNGIVNTADNLQFRSRFNKSLTWRV